MLHILKMCVGIDDVDHLRRVQTARAKALIEAGKEPLLRHRTRHVPRRADEIVDGGSLYWVIRGFVRVRQRIVAIERLDPPMDTKRCAFVYTAELIETQLQPRRPHQGWRYLDAKDAPADLSTQAAVAHDLPPEMASELRELGLL
jgi:hypothetical protein